jgi:hypothetical protein
MKNGLELVEINELIDKLKQHGCGELVEALLNNESDVYTKKGRLNKCGACRVMKCKTKQLEDLLEKARQIITEADD